jgi:hypothetical protein
MSRFMSWSDGDGVRPCPQCQPCVTADRRLVKNSSQRIRNPQTAGFRNVDGSADRPCRRTGRRVARRYSLAAGGAGCNSLIVGVLREGRGDAMRGRVEQSAKAGDQRTGSGRRVTTERPAVRTTPRQNSARLPRLSPAAGIVRLLSSGRLIGQRALSTGAACLPPVGVPSTNQLRRKGAQFLQHALRRAGTLGSPG